MKLEFFQAVAMSVLLYGHTTWILMKHLGEKTRWELHKDAACCFELILKSGHYKTAIQPLTSHLTIHISKISKTSTNGEDNLNL